MNTQEPIQPVSISPWWQDGETISEEIKEPYFLSKGVSAFFLLVKSWLLFPLQQTDALTCSESLLELIAWDRDIARFKNEQLSLFRKRVKYALINAKDSGSVVGFKAIFERLGVGFIEIDERLPDRDWDVISILLNDGQLSENIELLGEIIRHYGRTCRRYEFQVISPAYLEITVAPIDWEHQCFTCALEE